MTVAGSSINQQHRCVCLQVLIYYETMNVNICEVIFKKTSLYHNIQYILSKKATNVKT